VGFGVPINNKEIEMDFNVTTTDDADDTFTESVELGDTTVLKSLEKELKRQINIPPITLMIPSRPGMALKFDVNIESSTIQGWRKQCQNKSMADNFDGLKFSCLVIANKAESLISDSRPVVDDKGDEVNFKNPNLLDMLGVHKATEAVRKLYGIDGHVFVAADEILRAAGYDSESQDQQTDPTLIS
jgi:hypothetical protein